jgi:hypothetical protein
VSIPLDAIPPLKPFLAPVKPFAEISVGLSFAAKYEMSFDDFTGKNESCGCCPSGVSKHEASNALYASASAFVKGEVKVLVAKGEAQLTAQVCGKASRSQGVDCDGKSFDGPKENKGYFGVDINGKICVGGGWIKWCTTPYEQNLVAYPSKEAKKEACL